MGTRGLKASKQGIERAKVALALYSLSQNALAEELGLSRSTVNNFFKGKQIDRENFALICERIGLDLENTVAINDSAAEPSEAIDGSEIDALVQKVRQKVHDYIQNKCGEMRVLDMTRPIDLDTIYTDVNILQEITGRRRLDLAELLTHCSVEEFDRLGFAHVRTERRSGLAAVEEFDKLMLLGKPGAGKTTFLKRLATLCNSGTFQEHRVPIFVTLKDFGDSSDKPKLLTYISQWLEELGIQESQIAEQILIQGKAFLLLDGLDEVSERVGKQVLQEIQSFADRFSQNAFVISCRIAAKEFTFRQFTEVEVADFNDKQIADFVTRWFQAKQIEGKSKLFLEKLKGHPRIEELATNPLLLTLLCLILEGRTDFPVNRSELYEEGLDVLLKKWDGTRNIEREQIYRELSLKRKEDLLSQLAFNTFEPGNYFFKQKEAERLIETYIQNLPGAKTDPEALRLDSEAVLKSIEAQHGLLVERARGIYSFSHLTFHEYFAARELETRDDSHQALMSHLTKKRWREVILLTVGMLKNADSLLREMKSRIDGMLVTDNKLQQFLAWVQQKSASINTSYKPAAIRAFYFALARNRNHARRLDYDTYITLVRLLNGHEVRLNRNLESDLDRDLGLDRDIDIDIDIGLGLDLDLDLVHDLAVNLARTLDGTLARTLDGTLDINLDRVHDLAVNLVRAFDTAFARTLNRALDIDPALQGSLKELKEEPPNTKKDLDRYMQWWLTNGSVWTERLRTVMIKYRNIGYDWQFSDIQQQQLQQYYNANKLLVECLNSDSYISREIRADIEEKLLLPIAPIDFVPPG